MTLTSLPSFMCDESNRGQYKRPNIAHNTSQRVKDANWSLNSFARFNLFIGVTIAICLGQIFQFFLDPLHSFLGNSLQKNFKQFVDPICFHFNSQLWINRGKKIWLFQTHNLANLPSCDPPLKNTSLFLSNSDLTSKIG